MKKYNEVEKLKEKDLPDFCDIKSLSEATRLTEKLLYFLTQEESEEKKIEGRYKTFYIKKRDGNLREIKAPCASLKILQKWVLHNILYKFQPSQYSVGFVKRDKDSTSKGSPLVECAQYHRDNRYILKMDLKDFFHSIKRSRIYNLFILMGYNTYAANLLTNICTLNGSLPQGAVTSPHLANLVCTKMDARIAGYCNSKKRENIITYSRYADDLIFSSNDRDGLWKIYSMIKKIVEEEGFLVNEKKTRFLTPKGHKQIIGITVNDNFVKAPKEMKRKVRSAIHNSIINGDYKNIDEIRGYVAYIDSIEKGYKEKIIQYISGYLDDEITSNKEVVEQFNQHKFYSQIPDMQFHG